MKQRTGTAMQQKINIAMTYLMHLINSRTSRKIYMLCHIKDFLQNPETALSGISAEGIYDLYKVLQFVLQEQTKNQDKVQFPILGMGLVYLSKFLSLYLAIRTSFLQHINSLCLEQLSGHFCFRYFYWRNTAN